MNAIERLHFMVAVVTLDSFTRNKRTQHCIYTSDYERGGDSGGVIGVQESGDICGHLFTSVRRLEFVSVRDPRSQITGAS